MFMTYKKNMLLLLMAYFSRPAFVSQLESVSNARRRRETGGLHLVFLIQDINLVVSLFGMINLSGETRGSSSSPLRTTAGL